ncbi:Phosphoesterases [Plasmopara halstedii]|uniref:Phosphoesterases n=1 Tax=Plasmopara halstedii TaxID=4781 RepID=A0A0N7L3N1_PLAHL|nr:Phosphoesterases [Plasmopara halstedii]CEG36339.1 Phosphoesterases [Plasmopara halstedii]|eukprot:XP_024572708.1 Phosphoesterases [Plasmopara halstedii]
MRVVCVSDTHGLHDDALAIPNGDVFVHAGDFTDTGERSEVLAFNEYLGRLPHRYKLVIAGNHESSFDRAFYPRFWQQYGHRQQYDPDEVRALLTNALYLEDQAVLIEGFLFYGTPWQPEFCNWAFNLPRGDALLKRWRHIPSDTDVLITHTPPMGHGDLVGYQRVGCLDLLREVESRVRPKLHVFGHVHEGYGCSTSPDGEITYFNASICTHNYEPVNMPFVYELSGPPKRGPIRTLPLSASSVGHSIPRSLSSNDVSTINTLCVTLEKDAVQSLAKIEPRDYDLMLHDWLRLCSHKPSFIEKTCGDVDSCARLGKKKLREFRVDGTTSGLLFESTLKLRPVRNVEKRALRYLFSQGFRSNLGNYKAKDGTGHEAMLRNGNIEEDLAEFNKEYKQVRRERHDHGIFRRATVAVLKNIDEVKMGMEDRDREHLRLAREAAITLDNKTFRCRPRRNKSLQRRCVVPILDVLSEEQSDGEDIIDKTERDRIPAIVAEDANFMKDMTECALCKYKVSGHVHPGVPPITAVQVSNETKQDDKKIEMRSRADNPPHKRLSTWF